jgi:hypothetical protein
MDAGASGIFESDKRDAELERELHQLNDFLRVHFADSATGDGKILADGGDLLAIDVARPSDDGIRRYFLVLASEMPAAVANMHADFLECVRLKEGAKPFARGHEAFLMACSHLLLAAAGDYPSTALAEAFNYGRLHISSPKSAF